MSPPLVRHAARIISSIKREACAPEDVAGELGEVIIGQVPGRTDEHQITVCDLTGVGVQDAAIALLAIQKAKEMGLGEPIEG